MSEMESADEYWRDIVEGLYEQIRDLEQTIRSLESEIDASPTTAASEIS